jgi:hypothetical protein
MLARYHNDELSDFMNGGVRKYVGIIPEHVMWGGQSSQVIPPSCAPFWKSKHPRIF